MDLDIYDHLYHELFLKKAVDCNPLLYARFYSVIWPNEDAFKEFLTGIDPSIQLSAAKKIISSMQAEEDIFLPHFVFQNMIRLQQEKRTANPKGYIPQDHIIHSIHLYILGIYAFFNIPIFQRKLLSTFGTIYQSEDCRMAQFLKRWKIFSIYHDIGYVFESLVEKDGAISGQDVIEKYLQFRKQILLECVSRSVSRLIVATALLRRSHICFQSENYAFTDSRWIDEDGKSISSSEVCQLLDSCAEYKLIHDIQSTEGFRHVLPLLFKTKRLATVLDCFNRPVAFFIWDLNQQVRIIHQSSTTLSNSELDAIKHTRPLDIENIKIKYYVCMQDFWDSFLNYNSKYSAFQEEAQIYDISLPEELRFQFSLIYHDKCITQTYYDINQWLCESVLDMDSNNTFSVARNYESDMAKHYTDALLNAIEQQAKEQMNAQTISAENLHQVLIDLTENLKAISTGDILNAASASYDSHFGAPSGILAYARRLYENLSAEIGKERIKTPYIHINRHILEISPFSFESKNEFLTKLFERIEAQSNVLKIDIKALKNYHPDYSICDHGVLSAAMVFDALSFFSLLQHCAMEDPVVFAWDSSDGLGRITSDESIAVYADAIFSILLHNVYTKNSKPQYGLPYRQDIEKNTFSYFCTLMDNLQRWSRFKQIDFAKIDLPEDHYLGHNYDIKVSQGRLRIICNSSRVGKMRKQIDSAEDYLPGISKLVCVTEEEL